MLGFVDMMSSSIRRGLTQAWNDGMASCGIRPSDMTPDENARLEAEINNQLHYLIGFANDIETNSKASGGHLQPLFDRGELWASRYAMVQSIAMEIACKDKKLKWIMNPLKEHCEHCLRLNGRVYRASTWRRYNIYPKMARLKCRGFRCGCKFEPTSDPVTPGRPPQI